MRIATWTASIAASLALCAVGGCAAFQGHGSYDECRGVLDDGRAVTLTQTFHKDALRGDPDANYANLCVQVVAGDSVLVCREVARKTGTHRDDLSFPLGKVEARTDENRQRIWFVDTEAQCVVASLDCTTNAATGPADTAPPWATVNGGIALEHAAE